MLVVVAAMAVRMGFVWCFMSSSVGVRQVRRGASRWAAAARCHVCRSTECAFLDALKKVSTLVSQMAFVKISINLTWRAPPINEKPARLTRTPSSSVVPLEPVSEKATGSSARITRLAIWKYNKASVEFLFVKSLKRSQIVLRVVLLPSPNGFVDFIEKTNASCAFNHRKFLRRHRKIYDLSQTEKLSPPL